MATAKVSAQRGGGVLKTVLKVVGIILGILVALVVVLVAWVYISSSISINRGYDVQPAALTVPTDPAAIERGRHLSESVALCSDCHTPSLGGQVFIDDPVFGHVIAPNLTSGAGGVGAKFTDADWVRAIRHGIGPDGKSLLVMPAPNFSVLSDADLGAIIAYVKSRPPVDNDMTDDKNSVGPLARALYVTGQLPILLPGALIDHEAARPAAPEPGVSAAYGKYLVTAGGCVDCHGPHLSGGPLPGASAEDPLAANLTPSTDGLGSWTEADFLRAMREGIAPGGTPINEAMPWKAYGQMSDDELKAMWLHLQTLEPRPFGS